MNAGICIAITLGTSMAVFAQATDPRPAPPPPPAAQAQQQPLATAPTPVQPITLVGCVERESDYRRTRNSGRGGVAGTGAGVANEFILINAAIHTQGVNPADTAPAGTAGASGAAYELTGPAEGQLEQYIGRRVEIMGHMKSAPTTTGADKAPAITATVTQSKTGRPDAAVAIGSAAGRPAGQPTGGIDVAGHDLKLREFEVVSVREAAGSCGAAK